MNTDSRYIGNTSIFQFILSLNLLGKDKKQKCNTYLKHLLCDICNEEIHIDKYILINKYIEE